MVAAVEVYNKPDFKYREETFSILAVNAWELLFKAFILKNTSNNPSSLYVREHRTLSDGTTSRRTYIKRNRSGNAMTIGWQRAVNLIQARGWHQFEQAVDANLKGIVEIRDNAVHLSNENQTLSRVVQQLGAASLQNYIKLAQIWFNEDFSRFDFYLMPISFFRGFSRASAIHLSAEEKRVIEAIDWLHNEHSGARDGEYCVLLELEVRLTSKLGPSAVRLARGNDPNAIPITFEERDIRDRYPWDYKELTEYFVDRYKNFKQNQRYHDIRRPLADDARYATQRYLDPGNRQGTSKTFFSRSIINEFDKHYMKRGNTDGEV